MLLITQPRVGHAHNEILALQLTAREFGWDVFPAPAGWRLPADITNSKLNGVPYGSQTFCEVIAQQMNWTLQLNSFDWLARLPEKFLSRKVDFMTLGEAAELTETKFIKPADDKCFDAKVYEAGEFKPNEIISRQSPVLVSDIVRFDLEYRCFIMDGKVKTWSNYIYYDEIANPKFWHTIPNDIGPFVEFVESAVKECRIETVASVIDVGRIVNKGWAIIETNPAWASGLYGCDPSDALKVMNRSVGRSVGKIEQ